jgi:F-type H+-transporting ATPase subunit epsilon
MAMTVRVDIVSAEREIFSGLAELVVASGSLGEIGVNPGHAPLLTDLKPGDVRITKQGGEEEVFYVSGGMLEVQPHHVTVLADEALPADEIDEDKAEKARERARRAMEGKEGDIEYSLAAAELARASAQIHALRKLRKKHR